MCMASTATTIDRRAVSTPDPKRSARAADMKKMALCEPCAGIQRHWRRAPGHAELVQTGTRKELRRDENDDSDSGGGHSVNVTSYRCDRCGTRWEYENDKRNQQAGWSVVGQ